MRQFERFLRYNVEGRLESIAFFDMTKQPPDVRLAAIGKARDEPDTTLLDH